MTEENTGLPEAVGSIVNKLVENEGASFPFLVAAVGLNGSIWYGRVELIDAENGRCNTVAEKLVEGGFTFPINIMVIDSRAKGYLARIGTEDLHPVHQRVGSARSGPSINAPDLAASSRSAP